MTRFLWLTLFISFGLVGCAGDKAKLEEARYYLGKGGVANGSKAYNIVQNMIDNNSGVARTAGEDRFEAYRLYAGAQMARAGIDPIRMIVKLVYGENTNTIANLAQSLTGFTEDADELLADALTKLSYIIVDDDFTAASDRIKNGLRFQRGLVRFFNALRVSVVTSKFIVDGEVQQNFTAADCDLTAGDFNTVSTNLDQADVNFEASGLDDTNQVRVYVQDMEAQITDLGGDVDALCEYLEQQAGALPQ